MPPNSAQTERDHKLITDLRLACGTSVACLPVCQYKSAEEFVAPIAGLMLESHFAKAVAGRCVSAARFSSRRIALGGLPGAPIVSRAIVANSSALACVPCVVRRIFVGAPQARAFSTSTGLFARKSNTVRKALHGPRTITLLVQLPGSGSCEVIDSAGPRIGHVKDELIVKYDQLQGIKADQLQLFTLDRIFLDPGLTFIEAGIHTGTTLVVELTTASASTVIHAPGIMNAVGEPAGVSSGTHTDRGNDATTNPAVPRYIASDAWKWARGLSVSATSAVQLIAGLFESPPVGPAPRPARHEASSTKLGRQFKFVNRLEQCKTFARNFADMEALRGLGFEAEKRNLKVVNVAGLSGIGKTCFADAALPHLRDVYGAALAENVWPGEGGSHNEFVSELLSACDSQRNLRITPSDWSEAALDRQLGAALLSQWTKHCSLRVGDVTESLGAGAKPLADRVAFDTQTQLMSIADVSVAGALDLILAHAQTLPAPVSAAVASAFAIVRRPVLIVHLDEVQQCSPLVLKNAIEHFCNALLTRNQRVFLVITGLPSADVEQAFRWTSVASLDLILPLLSTEHMVEIVADLVGVATQRVPVSIRNALWMLGGVPRFLEYFLAAAARKAGKSDALGVKTSWEWLQRASLPDLFEAVQMTCLQLYRPADTPGCILDALFSLAVSERSVPLTCVLDRGHPTWTVARAQNARLIFWEGVPGGDGPVRMPPILLHLAHMAAGPSSGPRIVPLSRPGASLTSGDNESLAISVFMHRLRAAQIANVATVRLTEIVGVPLPAGTEDVFVAVPQCFALRVLDHQVVAGAGPQGLSDLLANTRSALSAFPLTTPAAFVNGRGAPFANSMLLLQEISIFMQEKQSVKSRQAEANGCSVPVVPPQEAAEETEKIQLSAADLPAVIIYVSDNRDRDDKRPLPAHTAVVASADLRRALLGSLVSGLRAHSLEENDTRAVSGATNTVSASTAAPRLTS